MPLKNFLFTSESVTEGHPDKLCDQVSDAILDAHLALDPTPASRARPRSRPASCSSPAEITALGHVDYPTIVRETVKDIGYTSSAIGFDGATCAVFVAVEQQSPDISQGVTEGEGLYKEQGAGDQGMMFGYACTETKALMPMSIYYAHRLSEKLSAVRRNSKLRGCARTARPRSPSSTATASPSASTPSCSPRSTRRTSAYDDLRESIIREVIETTIRPSCSTATRSTS